MNKALLVCAWMMGVHGVHAASVALLSPDQDAVLATGVSNAFVANNYGAAGSTAVAGANSAKGEQRSVTRFDTASAVATFDTDFGAGLWKIDSVVLRLTAQTPGGANPLLNGSNVAGTFLVEWIPTDSWIEGVGTPNAPASVGVAWNDLAALEAGAESQGTQSFSGLNGTVDYTLAPTAGLIADIKAGRSASLLLSAVDASLAAVFYSRTFNTSTSRPSLIITASLAPIPARTTDATDVTATSASLNGVLNAAGGSMAVSFDWGADTSYGSTVNGTPTPVTGDLDTDVTAALTNLTPSTTYHFRVKGVDGSIVLAGDDLAFTTLGLNHAPTIANLADTGINVNANTGAIPFTVGDVETAAGALLVSGTSSNLTLVPNANIVFGGTGSARTVTITPAVGKSGLATISVTVSDGSATTTDTFVLDVSTDTTAPTVTMLTPAINASIAEGTAITVSGTAADNKSLKKVQVQLNGGVFMDAVLVPNLAGTSATYSLPITPVPWTNTITVKSLDARGNASASVTRAFTYAVPRVLVVNVSGPMNSGSIAAPYSGPYPQNISLQAGKSYTLTAAAKSGYVFDGWSVSNAANTGITAAKQELPALTFTMQTGLTLTAKFIANPFIAVAGTYNGLVHASASLPAPGVSIAGMSTEGFFTAAVTTTGSFTGTLTLDGQALPVNGVFDNAGTARFGTARDTAISVARTGKPSVLVALHLDVAGGTDQITGSITQSYRGATSAVSSITADRAAYNGSTSTVPSDYLTVSGATITDGKFTVLLSPKAPAFQPAGFTITDYPQGRGYGTITITKAGKVTLSGVLADDTPIIVSSTLSKNKTCPLFAQLYSKLGFFSAQITLNKDDPDSDLSALSSLWSRPFINGQYYPYGWPEVIKTDLLGARYAITTNTSVLPSLIDASASSIANADLSFTGGALPITLNKEINITKADAVTNVPKTDNGFALKITRSTGAVSGSFTCVATNAVTTKPSFKGVIYQKGALAGGHGFFLSVKPSVIDFTGQSGDVLLLPKSSLR